MARQAKEKFHSEATLETYELLSDVISEYHSDFGDSEFLILMKHGGWKSKGKTKLHGFKVLGDDLRSTWGKDAILYLNADMWAKMSQKQREYVLDEALYGLDFKRDRHGDIKEAADGRALLSTVTYDIQGFIEVMQRHGAVTAEVKRLASVLVEMNQLSFDDIEKEEAKQIEQQAQHDGVKVTVDGNGVVQEVEDENQTTIEQYIEGETSSETIPFTDPPADEDNDELF